MADALPSVLLPPLISAAAGLSGVLVGGWLEHRRRRTTHEEETRRLRRDAMAALLVSLNHVYDETRKQPDADHEDLWGDSFERFIVLALLLPPELSAERAGRPTSVTGELTLERGALRRHLDSAWRWRDAAREAHARREPLPPAPLHEDVMDLLRPFV